MHSVWCEKSGLSADSKAVVLLVKLTRTLEEMDMTFDIWSFTRTPKGTRFKVELPFHLVTLSHSLTATCHN